MGFSAKQKTFNKLFILRYNILIDELFASVSNKSDWLDELEKKLEKGSMLVGAASAAVVIGAVAAPATGGLSLAATVGVLGLAGSCVIVAQFVNGAYKILARGELEVGEKSDLQSTLEENKLYFKLVMQEVGDILTLAYRNFLEDIIDENSITTFAYIGAEWGIEKLYKIALEQLKNYKLSQGPAHGIEFKIDPYLIVKHLMQHSHNSQFFANEKITIKRDHSSSSLFTSNVVPVKWVYGRSRIAFYEINNGVISTTIYKSRAENTFLSSHTTLPKFGYVSVDNFEIVRDKPLVREDIDPYETDIINTTQSIYYPVSTNDVSRYLNFIRTAPQNKRQSLNDYLSSILGINVIATCHDDRLKDLDLSGGNYSEVNWRFATLSGNLDNTIWENARLAGAKFIGANITHETNFNNSYLEMTQWVDLQLNCSFIQSKLRGAKIINCLVAVTQDLGCDWELAYFDENCRYPIGNEEWRSQLEMRLSDDLVMRTSEYEKQRNEFINWQREQDSRWQHQEIINEDNLRKIDSIANWLKDIEKQPVLEILNIMHRHAQNTFDSALTEQYIELNILQAGVAKTQDSLSLFDRLLAFKEDPLEMFFLLHGVIGSGKTLAVTRFFQELFLSCSTESDLYPIIIKLKYVKIETSENFLEQCLLSQFDRAQVYTLMQNFKCLVILDGLEDCGIDFNRRYIIEECFNFNKRCVRGPWKVLVTSSTQLLLESVDYRDRLRLAHNVNFPYESEYSISPLNTHQIIDYLNRYYYGKVDIITLRNLNLLRLARTPIMLYIICEVLSSRTKSDELPSSKIQFFEAFLDNWAKHVLQKTMTERLTAKSTLIFLKDFAYQMYVNNQQYVVRPIKDNLDALETERNIENNSFEYMFSNPLWKKAGSLAPLKFARDDVRGIMVYYIRTPFNMYALANKLFELLKEKPFSKVLNSWNHAYLVDLKTSSVFEYLADLVNASNQEHFYIDVLCNIVDASCGSDGGRYSKAASNAITLLNVINYDFSTHIDHRRWESAHINKANLSYAKFSGFYFGAEACFEDTKWQYAELIGTVFDGSNLRGARFFDGSSVIYSDKVVENFAVYPSDEPVIAYSVLKNHGAEDREIIIVGPKGEKYPKIVGHQTEIKAMAWGVRSMPPHVGYLASGSVSGTIRVWSVSDEVSREIAKFKTPSGRPINSICCYKDGDLIASGDDDNKLIIWSLDCKRNVFIYDLHARVNKVVFGRDEKIVVAVDDSGHLSIWDLSELKRDSHVIQEPNVHTKASVNTTYNPALSVSLSVPEEYVAVGYANGDIVIFKIDANNELQNGNSDLSVSVTQTLKKHTGAVNSIIWNAYCLVSGGDDGLVIVWEPNLGMSLSVYCGDGVPVTKVAWLMDGREIITNQDRKLIIYNPDLKKDSLVKDLDTHVIVNRLCLSDTSLFLGDMDGSIWRMSLDNSSMQRKQKLFENQTAIVKMSCSRDGRYLASVSECQTLKIFDLRGSELVIESRGRAEKILALQWFTDSTESNENLVIAYSDGSLILFAKNKDVWQQRNLPTSSDRFNILAFAKINNINDAYFVNITPLGVKKYMLLDCNSSFHVIIRELQSKQVEDFSFSEDNKYLLVKYHDNTLEIISTDKWKIVWRDKSPTYEKHFLWINDENYYQWLVVGTKYDLSIYSAENDVFLVKKIPKSVDNLAYINGYLYIGEKRCVDVFAFHSLVNSEDISRSFCRRFGIGTSVLGLNLYNARNIDDEVSVFASYHGAIVQPKQSLISMRNRLLSAIGFYKENCLSIPKPMRQMSTQDRAAIALYKSFTSLLDVDGMSNSGHDSPIKMPGSSDDIRFSHEK